MWKSWLRWMGKRSGSVPSGLAARDRDRDRERERASAAPASVPVAPESRPQIRASWPPEASLAISAQELPPPPAKVALVYFSRAKPTDNPFALLRNLRQECLQRNLAVGVSSVLVYQDGWFCQWLQATDEAALDATFLRLKIDPRHDNISVLYRGRPSPLPSSWSMLLRKRHEPAAQIDRRLRHLAQQATSVPIASPPSAVLAFCDDRLPPPSGPHRVQTVRIMSRPLSLAVAAVEFLGRHHPGARMTVARWGREYDTDTDLQGLHVDATLHGAPTRVFAIPRQVLAVGWVRALVSPTDLWVVMMWTLDMAGLARKLLAVRSALRAASGLDPATGEPVPLVDVNVSATRPEALVAPELPTVHLVLGQAPTSVEAVQLDLLAEQCDCRIQWQAVATDQPGDWWQAVLRAGWSVPNRASTLDHTNTSALR